MELSDVEGYQLSDADFTAERGSFREKDLPENVKYGKCIFKQKYLRLIVIFRLML